MFKSKATISTSDKFEEPIRRRLYFSEMLRPSSSEFQGFFQYLGFIAKAFQNGGRGLDRISILEGVAGKERGQFFQGGKGCKNKLKCEILNGKKVY